MQATGTSLIERSGWGRSSSRPAESAGISGNGSQQRPQQEFPPARNSQQPVQANWNSGETTSQANRGQNHIRPGCAQHLPQAPLHTNATIAQTEPLRPDNHTATPASNHRTYVPPHKRSVKPDEYAVQLFPNMTSLTSMAKSGSSTAHASPPPPDHHHCTALHAYLEHVDSNSGINFADAWLDIFHVTLGSLHLPLSKVKQFRELMTAAAARLPSLADLQYTSTQLRYSPKPGRMKADVKGIHFYHLGLTAATEHLTSILGPWMTAVQEIAANLQVKFERCSYDRHHLTVRSHDKVKVPAARFSALQVAVQQQPVTFQIAGFRVQLCASRAEELYGPAGLIQPNSEIRYSDPTYASCEAASKSVERGFTELPINAEVHEDEEPSASAGKPAKHFILCALSIVIAWAPLMPLQCLHIVKCWLAISCRYLST